MSTPHSLSASKEFPIVAEAILELTAEVSEEFIDWVLRR